MWFNFSDDRHRSPGLRPRVSRKQLTVTPAGGSATTLVTNTYDAYSATVCGGFSGFDQPAYAPPQHDDAAFGPTFLYRGNITTRNSIGGTASMRYETTGVTI